MVSPKKPKKTTVSGEGGGGFEPYHGDAGGGGTLRRIRARADSTGSTRGAFYDSEHTAYQNQAPKLEDVVTPAMIFNTMSTKKAHHKKKPRHTTAEHSMAEMAQLAVQDLLDDTTADVVVGLSPTPPNPRNNLMLHMTTEGELGSSRKDNHRPGVTQQQEQQQLMPIRDYSIDDDGDDYDPSDPGRSSSFFFSQLAHTPKIRQGTRETANSRTYSLVESEKQSLYGTDIQDNTSSSNPTSSLHSSLLNYRNRTSQQEEINLFSQMVKSSSTQYGAVQQQQQQQQPTPSTLSPPPLLPPKKESNEHDRDVWSTDSRKHRDTEYQTRQQQQQKQNQQNLDDSSYVGLRMVGSLAENIHHLFHDWLTAGSYVGEDGYTHFDEYHTYSAAGLVRYMLYHPITPEFTSLQQFNWAVIIGIIMGVYTAYWKKLIDLGVDFFWQTVPVKLLEWGVFTDVEGSFPIFHYMWILPALLGGILAWIFVVFPIKMPGQNEWISNIHSRGVQDHSALVPLFILSTMGMWSGLSLGPELYVRGCTS
jgi:hypothetical protein